MSIQIIGQDGSTVQKVDSGSNAGRVTLYDSAGVELKSPQLAQTFSAASSAFGPGATPEDVFTLTGSGSKTVSIYRFWIATTQTTDGINAWFVKKRSTANAGGTNAAVGALPHDSNNSAATATALQYTAIPTPGTLVDEAWSGFIGSPAIAAVVGGHRLGVQLDFVALFGQPIVLRGTGQVLSWSFNGAALPAGLSILAGCTWSEV